MANCMTNPIARIALLCAAALTPLALSASPLTVSFSGTFNSADTQTALVSPGTSWSMSFNVDSQPVVMNAGTDGFDAAFTKFSYKLAGSSVSAVPDSIRFFAPANGGLFTVFFGPESGHDSNGLFVPEFTLSGPHLFTEAPSSPTLSAGYSTISEILYTDAMNYDDQLNPGSQVAIVNATASPEPATLGILSIAVLLGASRYFRSRASRASATFLRSTAEETSY